MSSEPMKCEITGKETMIGLPMKIVIRWGDAERTIELGCVSPDGLGRLDHYVTLGLKRPSRKNERVKKPREEKKT